MAQAYTFTCDGYNFVYFCGTPAQAAARVQAMAAANNHAVYVRMVDDRCCCGQHSAGA